jgi:molybdopterin/thiamine biosynthesis adenylyltransferase
MRVDNWRQLDFYKADADKNKVLIVGAGHIGTWVALGLAMMGKKSLTVVDPDYIESHNLNTQFFSRVLVEKLGEDDKLMKVAALAATVKMIVPDCEIMGLPERIEQSEQRQYDAIFVAVDDMNVRKWIFNAFVGSTAKVLIDVRTGGEYFNVFAIEQGDSKSIEVYKGSLYTNEEASPLPCTGTAVVDVSLVASGEAIQRYRRFCEGTLEMVWSFHDQKLGGSAGAMHTSRRRVEDGLDKSLKTIHQVGTAPTSEERNG